MKLNLPNKLTLLRIIMVPLFMIFVLYPIGGRAVSGVIAAVIFMLTALTDMADGKIARGRNLVTTFGKFLDPLADKFMVFGALVSICASDMYLHIRPVFVWVSVLIIFRELAVTSIRLIASGENNAVISASYLGKLKTVSQCIAITAILIEPAIINTFIPEYNLYILSWLGIAAMTVLTVWSGADYLKNYWKFINPNN